jgi:predicted O-linked N-acetylglucosamine transferase (SPINDLY family)
VSGKAPTYADGAAALFQQAARLLKRGDMSGAEAAFGRVLTQEPDHLDALVGRAHALQAMRRAAEALTSLERALTLEPSNPAILGNHARVLAMLGRPAEALASLERALAGAADNFWLVNNRANVLLLLGRHAEALEAYDAALRLNPQSADVLYNRARLLLELQRPEEALESLARVLTLSPDFADAHGKRAVALFALKRYEEALTSFDRAARLKPDDAVALNQRGAVLLGLQRNREALADFERAVQLEPQYAEALANRGSALQRLRYFERAIRDFERSLALNPRLMEARYNRANLLIEQQRFEEAARAFDELLEARPDYPYAAGYAFHARLHGCDWSGYEARRRALAEGVAAGTQVDVPFQFLAVSAAPAEQLRCARAFVAGFPAAIERLPPPRARAPHDRIRLAYLSADFGEHATANLIAGLFEAHDRTRFELTALSFGVHPESAMKARLRGAFERFLDVRTESDRAIAARLQDLEIDIAVDLKGITSESRLGVLAYHAAPIQVSYLGYPGTVGAPCIDYLIADECVIPPDERQHYAERVVYLPDCYQVNDARRLIAPRIPERAEARLPQDAFVFCSFNSCYKITPEVFDIWMRLLARVEGSVLWLLEANPAAVRNLQREAAHRGVDPERLIFASARPHAEYLAQHRLADLFLDTLPINAHTTASDALWAGLPVLTCRGSAFAGRVAASLLRTLGLPELIAESLADYETLALELARSPARLAALRARLERNRLTSPLFDTGRFCRHIEAAYGEMWERYRRGEPPQGFAVAPLTPGGGGL